MRIRHKGPVLMIFLPGTLTQQQLTQLEQGCSILLENGDRILLEDGELLLLESCDEQTEAGTPPDPGEYPPNPAAPVTYSKTFNETVATLGDPVSLVDPDPSNVTTDYVNLFSFDDLSLGVQFQLHPTEHITPGVATNVSFTIPVPLGVATTPAQLRITDASNIELSTTVTTVASWRDYGTLEIPREDCKRSFLVRMNVTFPDTNPIDMKVFFNGVRSLEADLSFDVSTTWADISTATFFPSEYNVSEGIQEPIAVATFSPEWLCACTFKNRMRPVDTADAYWNIIEENQQQAGYTYPTNGGGTYAGDAEALPVVEQFMKSLVNDVRPHVTAANLITYEGVGNYAPWLYDRATTLWQTYLRTGKLKWFRHAHRASQFYKNHIGVTGYFDLRADDIKYSYGQSMLIDYWMTADSSLLPVIETVSLPSNSANYEETYTYVEFTGGSVPGWTERNAAYALQAQMNAWELTGDVQYSNRVEEIITALFNCQQTPENGWTKDGGFLHTIMAHEGGTGGGSGNDPVCSPWMSAILADHLMYYYMRTEDSRVLTMLSDLGDFYANHATYLGSSGELTGLRLPWYLASSTFTYTDSGDFGDVEHVLDVMGGMAKCMWAKKQLNQSTAAMQAIFDDLKVTLDWLIPYWIRTGQPTIDAGKTIYRLAPPRKGSWWFNSTADLTYLEEVVNG